MKKTTVISIIFMFIGYELLSLYLNKPIILPRLNEITVEIMTITTSSSFYEILMMTVCRTLLAFILALVLAMILGIISGYVESVREFLKPPITIVRSLPTISIIIIFLMWFGRNEGPLYIVGFVVFPIMYEMIVGAMDTVNSELVDVCSLFGSTITEKFRALYYPQLLVALKNGIQATLGLAFKVSVTAEVIAQSTMGIGHSLNREKTYLNMAGVFAWTIILIIIVFIFEQLIQWLMKKAVKTVE